MNSTTSPGSTSRLIRAVGTTAVVVVLGLGATACGNETDQGSEPVAPASTTRTTSAQLPTSADKAERDGRRHQESVLSPGAGRPIQLP